MCSLYRSMHLLLSKYNCQGSVTSVKCYLWLCERALTLPSCPVSMWARGFECARAVRSLVCFVLECGVRIPGTHVMSFWFRVGGSDTRAPCSVLLSDRAVSPLHMCLFCIVARSSCFNRLCAFMLCFVAVWQATCVFHWLRTFMLSCLIWTCGLWVSH